MSKMNSKQFLYNTAISVQNHLTLPVNKKLTKQERIIKKRVKREKKKSII